MSLGHSDAPIFTPVDERTFAEGRPPFRIPANVVHVWPLDLDAPHEVRMLCSRWLSPDEAERAQRFRLDRDRDHFVVAHGCLRYILGRYCNRKPDDLAFTLHESGKPFLLCSDPVMFNLTHSHGRGMIAVTHGLPVGIDIERVRQEIDHMALAKRFFSESEWRGIAASNVEHQQALFFRHWVGKEATLKAKGIGLKFPLSRCELVFETPDDEAVVYWREESETSQMWRIRLLPLESGWVGAVAAQGSDWTITYCGLRGPAFSPVGG